MSLSGIRLKKVLKRPEESRWFKWVYGSKPKLPRFLSWRRVLLALLTGFITFVMGFNCQFNNSWLCEIFIPSPVFVANLFFVLIGVAFVQGLFRGLPGEGLWETLSGIFWSMFFWHLVFYLLSLTIYAFKILLRTTRVQDKF